MALVISGDVVLAGQPYRQNVCLKGRAIRESSINGVTVESSSVRGVTIESNSFTGRIIESTQIPAQRWRLCIRPAGTA